MQKRITVVIDTAIEERVHSQRVAGKRIRSFSDVAREALAKGLDVLEQGKQDPPPMAA